MDLIYMNAARQDLGVLMDYKLDLAFGKDENDFELVIPAEAHCCQDGYLIYIEGTEYGGIVDSIQSNTGTKEITYAGRTWHGLINSKVIEPDSGQDYLKLTGEVNEILRFLIARLGLADMFAASTENSGLVISGYKMNRYVYGYDGIRKMLETVSGKLQFTFKDGKVVLSAVPRGNYANGNELDSDQISFKALRNYHAVNHLICLGRGELAEREVLHLYVDAAGRISKTQTFTGLFERTETYENSNAESLEDLERGGIERLNELAIVDEVSVDLSEEDANYDVQDLVGATDNVTGLSVAAEIVKKIVTVESGEITISYETGG